MGKGTCRTRIFWGVDHRGHPSEMVRVHPTQATNGPGLRQSRTLVHPEDRYLVLCWSGGCSQLGQPSFFSTRETLTTIWQSLDVRLSGPAPWLSADRGSEFASKFGANPLVGLPRPMHSVRIRVTASKTVEDRIFDVYHGNIKGRRPAKC